MPQRHEDTKVHRERIFVFALVKTTLVTIIVAILFISCKKTDDNKPIQETGNVTDIDGNVYATVKIGNQWWMAENLKVKHYRNNSVIPVYLNVSDSIIWNNKGAYCVYNNDKNAPGFLYNWFAVKDSNQIAPSGWHIPSDEEWKILEQYLGLSRAEADQVNWRGAHEGEKLKVEGTGYWYPCDNIWGTNESGFAAKAGGCRMFNGGWSTPSGIQFTGFWWSSSIMGQNEAWYRYLDYKNVNIFRYHGPFTYGFSIRCVKDN